MQAAVFYGILPSGDHTIHRQKGDIEHMRALLGSRGRLGRYVLLALLIGGLALSLWGCQKDIETGRELEAEEVRELSYFHHLSGGYGPGGAVVPGLPGQPFRNVPSDAVCIVQWDDSGCF